MSSNETSSDQKISKRNSLFRMHGLFSSGKNYFLSKMILDDNTPFQNQYSTEMTIGESTFSETLLANYLIRIASISSKYISTMSDRTGKIVDFHHPNQLKELIKNSLQVNHTASDLATVLDDVELLLNYCVQTGHPRFFNQLSQGLDVVSMSGEWLTSLTNANMFTYEIAPVFTLMEEMMIKKLINYIGWKQGDGIFSPGGAISNLYAILVARYNKFPQIKTQGIYSFKQLACFTSKQAHYSVKRAASIIGIGTNNVYYIDCNREGEMIPSDFEKKIEQALAEDKIPFFVSCTAGTTVMGAFDPIKEFAKICEKYKIWLHVDGAWGGGIFILNEYRNLIDGIEMADSVTWNPHKALGATLQCSVFLVKHENILENCNSMAADYLFQKDKHYDTAYDTGDKTIQCGRHNDIFKLWMMWKSKGDEGFEEQMRNLLSLSRYLQSEIIRRDGFIPLINKPQYLNICFWYLPKALRHLNPETGDAQDKIKINSIAPRIKALMMERGSVMVGYQPLDNWPNFFRMIVSNQSTSREDIDFLLDTIEEYGEEL